MHPLCILGSHNGFFSFISRKRRGARLGRGAGLGLPATVTMPTASAGIQGRGWQYYHQAKTATRKLPLHVDLSTRRPFSASSSAEKATPPPTWAAPGAARKPSWVEMAALLRQYAQREGHARVPLGHEESGVRLGAWLSRQWTEHMAGRLSQDRTWRLEKVGVDWGGAPPEASVRASSASPCALPWCTLAVNGPVQLTLLITDTLVVFASTGFHRAAPSQRTQVGRQSSARARRASWQVG